jgi:DNA-binding HxlR family transcriptional regulator
VRAGAHGLSLLAAPLNVQVIEALAEEPLSLFDLRLAVGSPPQTTMRGHLRALTDTGILERHRQNDFPGSIDYELTRSGRELIAVGQTLQGWLAEAPNGPFQLGTPAAKSAIKALVDGWSSALVRALAAKPLSLTELSSVITGLSYPSLERRLAALRLSGQVARCTGRGGRTPYAVTEWLRRALAPLTASARWERQHVAAETPSMKRIDVEAMFLLGLPLVQLPGGQSGTCRLAVELQSVNGDHRLAGVLVRLEQGKVVSCATLLEGEAGAWVSGSAPGWLRAVVDRDCGDLEVGGECDLALTLIAGINGALFGAHSDAAAGGRLPSGAS